MARGHPGEAAGTLFTMPDSPMTWSLVAGPGLVIHTRFLTLCFEGHSSVCPEKPVAILRLDTAG